MQPLNNCILLTEHFDIYQAKKNLVCYFELLMPDGRYILWEFINHKLNQKDVWKLK